MFSLPIGVHLLLMKDNKVLLSKRLNTGYADGMWSLPGGKIDGNETLIDALCREAFEEIGVMPKNATFKGMMHKIEHNNYENIATFFVVRDWSGAIDNKEPHKCSELQFFSIDELPTTISPYISYFFNNMYLKGNMYSEYLTQK